ncbi:MAG TPA: serine/threonine-protein kinase [Gemmatimonadales bacterium]|nr:serine/threonine-protein kinase [Gemmatimonadales bacterium]
MPMRRCPNCKRMYSATDRFCAADGTLLVEVQDPTPSPESRPEPIVATPSRASTLQNQVLEDRWRVVKKLGEGGMSYVYLAVDLTTTQTVAIKVLSPKLSSDPASAERLKREAALAMKLSHPSVCPIHQLGTTADGLLFLVMPFLSGELLSDRENRGGPVPVEEGIALMVQMCRGLEHAHSLEIIHRDLKPENVMLVPESEGPFPSRAVVMDFGLAKQRQAGPEVQKLTATGIVLGTPEFMSPEQIRGKALDGRSDIYALGVLGFEMFTGALPFTGRSAQEMMIARLRGQPKNLREVKPDLPATLEAVIAKSLAGDPANRYQTMAEFAVALQGSVESSVLAKLFGK